MMGLSKLLLALGLSGTMFYGVANTFFGSTTSIEDAMATMPQGSAVASIALTSRNHGACNVPDVNRDCNL